MSKGNVVELDNGLVYEAEILTASTEPGATKFAVDEFWDYVSKRWEWSEEKKGYSSNSSKDRRERKIFDGVYPKMFAVFASDKNGVFDSAATLYEFALSSPEDFEKAYQAAITANPNYGPQPIEVPKEGEPNPLA
jgi:hypothetical protein